MGVRVTDGVTGEGVPGVWVLLDPPAVEGPLRTNGGGYLSTYVPAGSYRLELACEGYESAARMVELAPGERSLTPVVLQPTTPVVVHAGRDVAGLTPGSSVRVEAKVAARDGSEVQAYRWVAVDRPGSARVRLAGYTTQEVTVALPEAGEYRRALRFRLDALGRLLDRWGVVGLMPADLAEAGKTTLLLRVTTNSGEYSDEVHLNADLSAFAATNSGIRNVPVGSPVMIQAPRRGRDSEAVYRWSLEPPEGSTATLFDFGERTPYFVPDRAGAYDVLEGGERRLTIYAGTWRGAVFRERIENWPVWMDQRGCSCHFEGPREQIFKSWWRSGHAEIFRQVLDTSPRNQESCFGCHTVGFNPGADSGGIDDAPSYRAFLADDLFWDAGATPARLRPTAGQWEALLVRYPDVARLANVQCDSCHGPTDSEAHETLSATGAPERMTLSSQTCAPCHQQPGDDSFAEWQGSQHGNYGRAVEVSGASPGGGSSGGCARCHTAWGALEATRSEDRPPPGPEGQQYLSSFEAARLRKVAEGIHPLTCVVCHDPHDAGSSFRHRVEKVPVRRLTGPATSTAQEAGTAGRAALCMTCHRLEGGPASDQLRGGTAPHAPQSDFLLGRGAFFVPEGRMASHARIEDGCIWCHMKPVPKASPLGYPRGGARHTFAARPDDCLRCHAETEDAMASMHPDLKEMELGELKRAIEAEVLKEIRRASSAVWRTVDGATVEVDADAIRGVELVVFQREMALALDLARGGPVEPLPLAGVRLDGRGLLDTPRGQTLGKAAWNYFSAARDGSRGTHNPRFLQEILKATLAQLAQP